MATHSPQFGDRSDEELVIHALLGNLAAFDALVRRYRAAVLLTARQVLGERGHAEDVAQEAFLLAFKALPQLDDPARFAGWLRAITRHRARRVLRREGRCQPMEPSRLDRLILAHSQEIGCPPHEMRTPDGRGCAWEAHLAALPPPYQDVLRLRYWEEWPVARIAACFSLPVTTVKWRLHHGRVLLRRLAQQREENEGRS